MTITPDRYTLANARKLVATTRGALITFFVLFLALGIALVLTGTAVALSLGTSLMATAMISVTLLLVEGIRNGEQLRAKELLSAGVLSVHKQRNLQEYNSLIISANDVDVNGYSLRSFSEQHERALRERARNGRPVNVRILLVDPNSPAAGLMEKAEHMPQGTYAGALQTLTGRLGSIDGVQIRLTAKHLSMMIFRIDEVIYTGPYPHEGGSSTALTFELRHGWVFDRQLEDFEALWTHASPLAAASKEQCRID